MISSTPSNFMYFAVGFFKSPLRPVSPTPMHIGVEHPLEHGQPNRGSPPTVIPTASVFSDGVGLPGPFLSHLHCNADQLALCSSWVGNHSWMSSSGNGSVVSGRHWLALTSGSGELCTTSSLIFPVPWEEGGVRDVHLRLSILHSLTLCTWTKWESL